MAATGPRQERSTAKTVRTKRSGAAAVTQRLAQPTRRHRSAKKHNAMIVAQLYGKATHYNTLRDMIEYIEKTTHVRKLKNAAIKQVRQNYSNL
jgi:hypothetical protein